MRTKTTLGYASMIASSLLLCNCATIFGGGRPKDVTLNSNPSGASVTVTDKDGTVIHQGVTPTTVKLKRSSGYFKAASYNASFDKKGYPQHTVNLKASMNPWYLGNLVFGGLIGFIIVDPLTGAMWTLDSEYTAQLGATAMNNNGDSQTVQIFERSQIPKEWEPHLVAVR